MLGHEAQIWEQPARLILLIQLAFHFVRFTRPKVCSRGPTVFLIDIQRDLNFARHEFTSLLSSLLSVYRSSLRMKRSRAKVDESGLFSGARFYHSSVEVSDSQKKLTNNCL